jgi:hypothetical protein
MKNGASMAVNSGMLAFSTEAVPLAMCSSAQAMRAKGTMLLSTAMMVTSTQRRRERGSERPNA